jgi:O-acetyl-ADP-ribose deacetylase (regulator of RNase III)
VTLHLVDLNSDLVQWWKDAFTEYPEVDILCEDMLKVAHTCVVSPANSFGFMDGGIDYVYYTYFGTEIQVRVQEAIARRPEGMLPVGASLLVRTGDVKIPFLLVAPTMEMPGAVRFSHCYHAMVAVLRMAHHHADTISDVFCPGLATGVGRVEPEYAATEMAAAYHDWHTRQHQPKGHGSSA